MSGEYTQVEQDFNVLNNGDELPTYDDLAEQNGPNSRLASCYFCKNYPYFLIGLGDGEDG